MFRIEHGAWVIDLHIVSIAGRHGSDSGGVGGWEYSWKKTKKRVRVQECGVCRMFRLAFVERIRFPLSVSYTALDFISDTFVLWIGKSLVA